jgi:hypothetical protein
MTGTIYNKPGWQMRLAAFAFMTEQADFRRLKRRRKRKRTYTAAQRAEYAALREAHPEIGATPRQPKNSRLPKSVWKALHRKPEVSKSRRKVTLPRLKFENLAGSRSLLSMLAGATRSHARRHNGQHKGASQWEYSMRLVAAACGC